MLKLIRYPLLATGLCTLAGFTAPNSPASTGLTDNKLASIHNTHLSFNNHVNSFASEISGKYDEWRLSAYGMSKDLFNYAVKGYQSLLKKGKILNRDIISIADLSKASTQKRLFIINIKTGRVLFNTFVAHGRNSGQQYAKSFSNEESSLESSLGFYITTNTYSGVHGYSLKLDGCEKGFNDNAAKRAIVIHGADYVSESFIHQKGYLGRSHGCPAVPAALSKKIIDVIKNGSCLFIYSPHKKYLTQSALLNS